MGGPGGRPRLSVIIASVNGLPYLEECLRSLEQQSARAEAEVIVVDRCGGQTASCVRDKFPWVVLIAGPERHSIPELRALGMLRAAGEILVITEDHCIAPPTWYEEILRAHRATSLAIGGAVENASVTRLVDWAVYFCEYSRYMGPVSEGPTDDIPGNNASYKRAVLDLFGDVVKRGVWETILHWEIRRAGHGLGSHPGMWIWHKKSFGVGEFLAQRYHFARSFAAMRVAGSPWVTRALYAGGSPALPVLLVGRIGGRVLRKRRHVAEFLRALPLIILFTVSWSVGEFCGYLWGPGTSHAKVE